MKKAIAWFTENHVASNLLMLFLLVGGILLIINFKVEIFPEVTLDRVVVSVVYQGASPEEIEESIIKPIEEAVSGLSGVNEIDSTAEEGLGVVVVEALKGYDVNTLYDDIKAEVDRLDTLPEEAEDPVVEKITKKNQVLSLALYGYADEGFLKKYGQKIKEDIAALKDVSFVELSGIKDNEIHIKIDELTLLKYGLSLTEVANKIRSYSHDIPLGRIKEKGGELLLRFKGKRYTKRDFEQIPLITNPDGSVVRVKDIASVEDTFEDVDLKIRFMGKPAVLLIVYRIGEQNALTVAREVKEYVKNIQKYLPENVSLRVYDDQSRFLKDRIRLLLKNMAYGLILVSITLTLFLNIRLAFWVTLGIPISFAGAFLLLPYFDISINMISLFGFIMVLGIVVDDAIVVGENIYTKYQQGNSPFNASVEGAYEVGRPVIFSVLTTIAAFMPLLFGSGQMGKFMTNIPLVVNTVLFVSLLEAIFILPCHLKGSIAKIRSSEPKSVARLLNRFIHGPYDKILNLCLRYPYIFSSICLLTLLFTVGLVKGGHVKFTFFPKVESDYIICNLTMPPGTPISYTENVMKKIEKDLMEVIKEAEKKEPEGSPPLLKYSLSLIGVQLEVHGPDVGGGDSGGHVAQMFVELLGNQYRHISAEELTNMWREKVGQIPGAESVTFSSELFSFGKPIEVRLSHPDYKTLVKISEELQKRLKNIPGVFDVGDTFVPGKKEIQLKIKPTGLDLGVNSDYIASEVRAAFFGAEALSFQREKDEVTVRVIYPEKKRMSYETLTNMWIKVPSGDMIPLKYLADFQLKESYFKIKRVNSRRVVTVFADVDETKNNANELRGLLAKKILPEIKKDYPDMTWSWAGEGKEQKESMEDIFRSFIFAMMGIYVLLAIPLRSYTQPLLIMTSIPFSIIGAVWGHMALGFNLTILSMFGIVGLAGVAVNDSLVLVDAANNLRKKGLSVFEVAHLAGKNRFRAVILTSITTFAGLTPMIMEKSLQAQFLIPMAISLGFGILFSTFITLLLIPCLLVISNDIKKILQRILGKFV